MGDSLENPDTSTDQNVVIVEYNAFANYLRRAVTILLPEEDSLMPPALNVALEDPSNQDYIRKFLCDSQVQALYIQRSCMKGRFFFLIRKFLLSVEKTWRTKIASLIDLNFNNFFYYFF